MTKFPNLILVKHPLVQHKLSTLRQIKTSTKEFNELTREITLFLAYEATKDLPLSKKLIKTPLENFKAPFIHGKKPVILPILRAGLGMVDGFLTLMPSARVGHIGLYRDKKTLEPQFYYFKIPSNHKDRQFYVCDPTLATGGSAIDAVNRLKKAGIKNIIFVTLIAAPEGIKKMLKYHPDIKIYAATLDRELNSHGYILPGLGDCGDRLFGTQ